MLKVKKQENKCRAHRKLRWHRNLRWPLKCYGGNLLVYSRYPKCPEPTVIYGNTVNYGGAQFC
ncbi:hypothetical protein HanPSC8_Chr03g0119851 [Helianthus annuus]|nr:hypothetical protein HanPSC8_Chr03g0119851 [Helianthus annuus]